MVTLKSPADIPAVVASLLGFEPHESLVILGIGAGPTARIDITPATVRQVVEAFSPAAKHWAQGVLVALYSADVDLDEVLATIDEVLPVRVILGVRVDAGLVHHEGHAIPATPLANVTGGDELAPAAPGATREDIVRAAREVDTPREALALAWAAYQTGKGAHAWVYLDRYASLGGADTDSVRDLERRLTDAVDPRDD